MSILTINGKKFAKTANDFVSSLTDPTGTCVGFWKPKGTGILLMNMQKTVEAYIVNNSHDERFIVTAFRDVKGRINYMRGGMTDSTMRFLGLQDASYSDRNLVAETAVKEFLQLSGK